MIMHEQIQHLEHMGDEQSPQDIDAVTKLRALLKGDTSSAARRGTLLTMIATMAAPRDQGKPAAY